MVRIHSGLPFLFRQFHELTHLDSPSSNPRFVLSWLNCRSCHLDFLKKLRLCSQPTRKILHTLRAMYRKFPTVRKERRLASVAEANAFDGIRLSSGIELIGGNQRVYFHSSTRRFGKPPF